ncbi:hypothetical protein [Catenovulum agarivorans]|uniref:hypothetical protein n=1 Tax=Catenovulum agarivorans TaxID=1172192 RepID=UPI0002E7D8A1|nr:hypothetical protein [Catenovulum agarivorans]
MTSEIELPELGKPPYFYTTTSNLTGLDKLLNSSQIQLLAALTIKDEKQAILSCEELAIKISRKPVTVRHIAKSLVSLGILKREKGKGRGNKPADFFSYVQQSKDQDTSIKSQRQNVASNWFSLFLQSTNRFEFEQMNFSTNMLVYLNDVYLYVEILSELYSLKTLQAEMMADRELSSADLYNNQLKLTTSQFQHITQKDFDEKLTRLSQYTFGIKADNNQANSYFLKLVTKVLNETNIEFVVEFPIELIYNILDSSLVILLPKLLELIKQEENPALKRLYTLIALNVCINDTQVFVIKQAKIDLLLHDIAQSYLESFHLTLNKGIEIEVPSDSLSSKLMHELNITISQGLKVKLEQDIVIWSY